ncbi:MAG: hypothetical protein ACK5XA_08415 [Tagaea sp.]
MNRRSWLRTAAGLLVAPAIVRAESLMPVRRIVVPGSDYASAQLPSIWSDDLVDWVLFIPSSGLFYDNRTERISAADLEGQNRFDLAGLEPGQPIRVELH